MNAVGPRVVIGTAGHIDHGKTSLLRALTGIDADRLPEERRRGMTIDVGYAHVALPDGEDVDFVDVPGHDRLVGNMLVGAGEIDAALVVVAADDGPRAQTLEHLELLDALGVSIGVVALTKVDLVGEERVAAVRAELDALLASTSLRDSRVILVSAVTGVGLDALREALARVVALVRGGPTFGQGRARLAIDRAFAIRGRGSVVTGSLRGGSVERGTSLRLEPDGRDVRVREVQVHGSPVERAEGGGRVALNLAGIELEALRRGQTLAEPDALTATRRMLVLLRPAIDLTTGRPRELPRHGERLRLHLATDQMEATVARDRRTSAPLRDGAATAILRLERPMAAAVGDSFVLRRPSPGQTAAGGRVLDPTPPLGPSRRRATLDALVGLAQATTPAEHLAALVALHGAVPASAAAPSGTVRRGPALVAADAADGFAHYAVDLVTRHAASDPLAGGLPLSTLRAAVARGVRRTVTLAPAIAAEVAVAIVDAANAAHQLTVTGDRARLVEQPIGLPPEVRAAMDRLEVALSAAAPPGLAEAAKALGCPLAGIRALESEGRIVRLDADLAYTTETYGRLAATALRMAADAPLSPAAFRDATRTSRKYALAILEDLDRRELLRRTPIGHVPGRRAPAAAAAR